MSKLEFYARPLVAFDPENKDHRRWYHEFLEYQGWGTCPVRFICPNDIGHDLTIMIRNELIEYYVRKEFKPRSVAKKPQKKVSQKSKKTVDKAPKE
jgi:hypothetical protein